MAWIQTTEYGADWPTLDDTEWEFPPDFPKLVLCDRSVGIDRDVMERMTHLYTQHR